MTQGGLPGELDGSMMWYNFINTPPLQFMADQMRQAAYEKSKA